MKTYTEAEMSAAIASAEGRARLEETNFGTNHGSAALSRTERDHYDEIVAAARTPDSTKEQG